MKYNSLREAKSIISGDDENMIIIIEKSVSWMGLFIISRNGYIHMYMILVK